MKTIRQQVRAMQRHWPGFALAEETLDKAVWFGSLAGLERTYRLMIEYGLPKKATADGMCRRFPLVRVLSPRLELRENRSSGVPRSRG